VLRYIQSCDAVLVPSLQEGFPNVALEAAACGRTVLASKLDGIAELVVHGETGALVPPGDARSWASALTQYAQRRDDLHAFGRNARSRAENYFDANAYPENMVDLYHAALREPLERSL
jgi:glycosyltransferase involved in cell wall biosynthesis